LRENEGVKNRDRKYRWCCNNTRKTTAITTTKSLVCSVKVLDLFFCHPILVFALGLGFVGKGVVPLVRQLDFFVLLVFFLTSLFYGLSITCGSSEVVLPNDWFVSSIWFLLSTGQVATGT
jgi:hypothetical protein